MCLKFVRLIRRSIQLNISFTQKDILVFSVLAISGFLLATSSSLCCILIFETKGIEITYGGTAIGLGGTLGMLGAFISPPLDNSLDAFSQGAPFIFLAVLVSLGLPLFLFFKRPILSKAV